MKGCPFNSFGPCRKDECIFFIETTGIADDCMLTDHYHATVLVQSLLLDLVAEFAARRYLEPDQFSSADAYEEHVNYLHNYVEKLHHRLQIMRKTLKGDKS